MMFNRDCKIQNIEDSVTETARFNIIQLNSNNLDFQRYFFGVMSLVLQRLKSIPSTATLKAEITKVIRLLPRIPNSLWMLSEASGQSYWLLRNLPIGVFNKGLACYSQREIRFQ